MVDILLRNPVAMSTQQKQSASQPFDRNKYNSFHIYVIET
jgi:hypothetical protein